MGALRPAIPNAISLSRIPLGVAFLLLYDTSDTWQFSVAITAAFAALLTDIADGRLARHWGVASDAGALIDGLGDKAFYVAVYMAMAQVQPTESLLLWALIFREVALYALRTIDAKRTQNTKQLRWASLLYAFVIRMYFLCFFLTGWCEVSHWPTPAFLEYGYLLGYLAALLGYIGLAKLVQQISVAT